jgi:hypothetical protein
MKQRHLVLVLLTIILAAVPAAATAQTSDNTWSAEVYVGWDNGISGDLISSGIGTIVGQPAVVESQSYDDVYGTGARWRFSAAYRLSPRSEVLGSLEYASAGGDVVQVGTVGGDPLFAQFDDYRAIGIEAGYRYYFADRGASGRIKPYVGGLLGVDIVREIDAVITIPQQNVILDATNFYDRTGAFVFGLNGGALFDVNERLAVGAEIGLRHHSGLSQLEALTGTGLEDINDSSGRWTLPLTVGARVKF